LINIFRWQFFYVYDILCAKNFNPNERTGFVFSSGNPKFLLGEQLWRAVVAFYNFRSQQPEKKQADTIETTVKPSFPSLKHVYQCSACLSIYDEASGDEEQQIAPGTTFNVLPASYCCNLCESPKTFFVKKEAAAIGLATV
jgi:rubredoxin